MRVLGLLIVFLLAHSACADLAADYSVVVEENGNALVTLVIKGYGTMTVPLPLDVEAPAVRDALYIKEKSGVEVSIDADGQSTIVYKTSLLAARQEGEWAFSMDIPAYESATVVVYLPVRAQIRHTSPTAAISTVGNTNTLIWTLKGAKRIEAGYAFPPAKTRDGMEGPTYVFIVVVGSVILTGAIIIYLLRKKAILITKGKANVLKTLSPNEGKIVTLLLQHIDGIKRNELEKMSGISKSSLASSLYNLETKNILHIDKAEAVHFVELTEWFKKL